MPKRLTNDEFIAKAKEKHGDTYDYSKTFYVNTHIPVMIVCRKHGEFTQTPHNHLLGSGCPICAATKKMNKDYAGHITMCDSCKHYDGEFSEVCLTCCYYYGSYYEAK